jgi:cell division protein FtsW (lipid II flippase)
MKRSVRLAAKAHNIAIVVLLVCATGLGVLSIMSAVFPARERTTGALAQLFFALLGVAFAIMVATGFHIAVADALGRIERREKNSASDEGV